jgi:L-ascorbate metabolism protein UlaG (beta-lactamase superfamily)
MELTWYGHSCFRLRERGGPTIITDPYDDSIGYSLPRLRADIVTVSHDHGDHNHVRGVRGEPKVLTSPGEYEVRDIFITGIPTFHDRKQGEERGRNVVFTFDFDGLSVCHLGDLGHVLNQSQAEALGSVDVLLIPVGGVYTIAAAAAAEVVSLLEPRIVVPMHYKTKDLNIRLGAASAFLKEMGAEDAAPHESLNVTKTSLPEETEVRVLEYRQ